MDAITPLIDDAAEEQVPSARVEVIVNESTGVREVVLSEEPESKPQVKRQCIEPEPVRTRSGRVVKPVTRFTYESMADIVVGNQGDAYADPDAEKEGACESSGSDDDELASDDSLNEFVADDDDEVVAVAPDAIVADEEADAEAEASGEEESEDDDDDDDDEDSDNQKNNEETAVVTALPELPPW